MKTKKTARSRRRISFAVDRDEIEVNSDWVEAVMALPSPVALPLLDVQPQPNNQQKSHARNFSERNTNSATDEESATGVECSSVEITAGVGGNAPVADEGSVARGVPLAESASVAEGLSVVNIATVKECGGFRELASDSVENPAAVAHIATVRPHSGGSRIWRPRPLRRITDGLTPGQYAVYSLMYEAGERDAGDSSRIYTGGYADLRELTGLSKRGVQNVVGELQQKQVIRLRQKPGFHRSETSSYVVPDGDAVIAIWLSNGWRYALGKSKSLTGVREILPQ